MGRLFDFMLPPAKSSATAVGDGLFHFINEVSLIFLLGITFAIIYFAIKYKRKSEKDETPVISHNNTLEITWSVIPLILVLIVFGWGYSGFLTLTTPPDNAYEVKVTGLKWAWSFEYDNGVVSPNELHVPAGRPVKLVMKSQDIIHSFFVPDYRIKHDVLPNRYTMVWFKADEPGESQVFCTEYCGTKHSDMLAKVVVHTQEDFDKWLASQPVGGAGQTPAEYGKSLVSQHACIACHSADGTEIVGPSFKGLWGKEEELADGSTVLVDENYIRESIINPSAKIVAGYDNLMNSYIGQLDDEQIDAIIEYIKTLQ